MIGCVTIVVAIVLWWGLLTLIAFALQFLGAALFGIHASIWVYLVLVWALGAIGRIIKG